MLISRELKRHKCIRNIVLYWYKTIFPYTATLFFCVFYFILSESVVLKHCRDSFLFFRYGATNNHMTPGQEFILFSLEGLQPSSSIQWRCLFGIHDGKRQIKIKKLVQVFDCGLAMFQHECNSRSCIDSTSCNESET